MTEAARTKDEVLKDFRTRGILEAARRVIGELGYADASMERIAQEAGVAKGTLYLYFENKDGLLDQALAYGLDQLVELMRQAVATENGALPQLRAVVLAGVNHARQHRAFFQALVDARHARPQPEDEGARLHMDLIAELVQQGTEAGALRAVDAERTARLVSHAMSGLVAESLLRGRPFPEEEDVDAMLDVIFHGLAVQEERS
jgi:AcrR family transcriptional regulator